MSIRSNNTRVQSVSASPAVDAAAGAAAGAAIGGAILLGFVVTGIARLLSKGVKEAYDRTLAALPPAETRNIKPNAVLRAERNEASRMIARCGEAKALSSVEQAKLSVFTSLAATPYFITDRPQLERSLEKLARAETLRDVSLNEGVLLNQIEHESQAALIQSITLACGRAALECGFPKLQTDTALDGTMRVIASDDNGRALVSEITADKDAGVMLEHEVVGITDGTCTGLLDEFEARLSSQGVRSHPGTRSFTGGVCELAAARDFVRRKLKPKSSAAKPAQPKVRRNDDTIKRRSQKLNSPVKQRQR